MSLRDEVQARQKSKRKAVCQAVEVAPAFGKDQGEWLEMLTDLTVTPADLAAIATNHEVPVSRSTIRNHRNGGCCCGAS